MTPAAIEKAAALRRHVKHIGCTAKDFRLVLTKGEAYELLDHIASGGTGTYRDMELLRQDIREAKIAGDPWIFLNNWTAEGFEIVSVESLH